MIHGKSGYDSHGRNAHLSGGSFARDGQDCIVPVDRSFGKRSPSEQARIQEAFQRSAAAADIAGVVVPVWEDSTGRMAFRAPPPWHEFFKSIDMVYVATALNRSLSLE